MLKTSKKLKKVLKSSHQKPRSKTPSQRPNSQTPTIRRLFTPTVNKSFTCYKDRSRTNHTRSASLNKTKDCSTPKPTKTKSLRSTQKFLMNTSDYLTLDSAKIEMNIGNYSKALEMLNRVIGKTPKNLEAVYSRGVCCIHLNKNEAAVNDFLLVLETDPKFDKQLYIALYMCFINLKKQSTALRYLTKGLKKYPGFIQALLLRGQLYNKAKKYQKALQDFQKVLSLDKQHSIVLLHIAESYTGLLNFESALQVLNLAICRPEVQQKAYVMRVKIEFELGKFEEAIEDAEKVLKTWPSESSVYYYKGVISFIYKKFTDAAICFEQTIQGEVDTEMVNKSLFYLGTIKISERDFYGALHTFERSLESGQSPELKAIHFYTEGVISLMKRKLDESIEIFTKILESNEEYYQEYITSCYENRGFAYFSLKKYEMALKDFHSAEKYGKLEKASEFNIGLCEAILLESKAEYRSAIRSFKAVLRLFPKNIMPDICRCCIYLHLSSEANMKYLEKAEALIGNILKSREPESEVLFYKSIIRFHLKEYESALEYSKKAIEKADENIASHYINRGLCYVALKKYEEAIQDFTIALQLDESLQELYIYRGISAFLQDDLQLATEDIQSYNKITSHGSESLFKLAKLQIIIGSYDDAIQLLDSHPKKHPVLLSTCYMLMNNLPEALNCIKNSKDLKADKELLQFLLKIKDDPNALFASLSLCSKLKDSNGEIFSKKYLLWILGIIMLYNKEYTEAIAVFQSVLEILHESEPEIFADSITIEEENCEILYNIALCSLLSPLDDLKANALMIFEELAEVLNEKHKGQLLFLSGILNIMQKNGQKAEKLLKKGVKSDPETLSPFLDSKDITLLPLHTGNEFSSIFPLICIKVESFPSVFVRPAIVLPRPEIECDIQEIENELKNFFSIGMIVPRPEAPWLLRTKGSIQFTDTFLDQNQELETETEEKQEIVIKSKAYLDHVAAKSQAIFRSHKFLAEDR